LSRYTYISLYYIEISCDRFSPTVGFRLPCHPEHDQEVEKVRYACGMTDIYMYIHTYIYIYTRLSSQFIYLFVTLLGRIRGLETRGVHDTTVSVSAKNLELSLPMV
jgi:hypothetical protein